MIEIEIDGKKIEAPEGSMIIEAADKHDIYIPRFCYHKKLTIAANCRMCLIEVEKTGKPLPACATPVVKDMKIFTKSQKAMDAQRAVMEYLLINHPLDCPICDQGGECELQDLSMGYGRAFSEYKQTKRSVFKENIGPLIDTEMTRCIHCTRCVRFGEEVAGMRELGATFRGEEMEIGTYVKHMMQSELSANIIDLCPVGALNAKPNRYAQRGWELRESPAIASHDCVGANIYIHSRGQEYNSIRQIMRVVPRENEAINETWISDRDRFSFLGLSHPERVLVPRMKLQNGWVETDWHMSLTSLNDQMQSIMKQYGPDEIAALISPNATVEECYLLQKWLRACGSNHIDHRLRRQDFSNQQAEPLAPHLGMKITEIESLQTILLVGSDICREQPLLSVRLRKANKNGAQIIAINPSDYRFNFPLQEKIITTDLVRYLAEIAVVIAKQCKQEITELQDVTPSQQAQMIGEQLLRAHPSAIFLGDFAINHPQASIINQLLKLITELSHTSNNPIAVGTLTEGANSSGAYLAGAIPHRGPGGTTLNQPGIDAKSMLTTKLKKVYFLFGTELEFDCGYAGPALHALQQADLVVCMTSFVTKAMTDYADYILPIAPSTETDGTYINIEGIWQSFQAITVPLEQVRPGWQVVSLLAQTMGLTGFDYQHCAQVHDELKRQVEHNTTQFQPQTSPIPRSSSFASDPTLIRLANWPIYRVDGVVRRTDALQQLIPAEAATIAMHTNLAARLNLSAQSKVKAIQGNSTVILPWSINNQLAENAVLIPSGLEETAGFGEASALIELVAITENA